MAIRRKRIQALAQELLEKQAVKEAPVPVRQIAKSQGVRLLYRGLEDDLSGFVYREGTESVIGVNTSHSQTRQNFTVAHELGHLLLHQNQSIHYDHNFQILLRSGLSSQGTNEMEIEANLFAAELLMPRAFLEQDLKKAGAMYFNDDEVISSLAKKYGVSTQALVIRLKNLGYIEE